jgi:hypothetical protein
VAAEGATAGGEAETETLIEVPEEGVIGEVLDIQDHHLVGVIPETVDRSETPCHDLIHMCPVEGGEIIEEDLQLQNQSHLSLLGPCRILARRLDDGIECPPDLVLHLADVLDLQIGVAPIEGEGEAQTVELDGDRQHHRMSLHLDPHLHLGDEGHLQLL